ncbi:vacuolar protein-sorting-associated protein [Xylariaceae sp. AK1471]|nr:vacuolar protein-sorting-associated protein [Xylariaceae sp. AK1471]
MATPTPSYTTAATTTSISSLTPTTTFSSPSPSSSSAIQQAPQPPPPPSSSTTTNGFQFPREYHFPPFFTRQPNLSTAHSQKEKWATLILSYCAHHKIYKLSLTSPATEELFHNRRIGKRLSLADAREVLEFMRRDGRVEFIKPTGGGGRGGGEDDGGGGGGGDVAWVYWKTPEEWAQLIEAWVDDTAQKGTVLTLYELSQGEDTIGTEFHGLDLELLQKALQVLVKRSKAQIFGQEDQLGVKFF